MQKWANLFFKFSTYPANRHHISIALCKNDCLGRPNVRAVSTKIVTSIDNSSKKHFTISDLLDYIENGKVFYLKQLNRVFHTIDFDNLSTKEATVLLKCCGSIIPDSTREQRNETCQNIYRELQKTSHISIEVYNTYLKSCNQNNSYVNPSEFFSSVKCEPDTTTYKLLLENVCQLGKVTDALQILQRMKDKNITVDTSAFNKLVMASTLAGGLVEGEKVIDTMKLAQLQNNRETTFAIYKALIRRNSLIEFKQAVEKYPLELDEEEFLTIVEEVGIVGSDSSWLSQINQLSKNVYLTHDVIRQIEKICVHLVHMGQPGSAMYIFKLFVPVVPQVSYGFSLLKEMLYSNVDITHLVSFAKSIEEEELNERIFEDITEIALKVNYKEPAWTLLANLKTLRPHFFWPLLIHARNTAGEDGLFQVLKRAKEMGVKPDFETLQYHVLPYCDLTDLKLLILKLQQEELTVREILSPLLLVLLFRKKVKRAFLLSQQYNVQLAGDKFLKYLANAWAYTQDSKSTVALLQKYCESNNLHSSLLGNFLKDCCQLCSTNDHFANFVQLLKNIKISRLQISTEFGEELNDYCDKFCADESLKSQLALSINSLLDFRLNITNDDFLHPRDMDLGSLECHLVELEEKNMETRGVLRRLILLHADKGNVEKVQQFRERFLEAGYEESAGMKSSIMHSFVLGKQLNKALDMYDILRVSHPQFSMDSFKFIDLAKLLIENDEYHQAFVVLNHEISKSKPLKNTKTIQRNCRELLNACQTEEKVNDVFNLLMRSGFIVPNNVMLGPLVRVHLHSGDINNAVTTYVSLSQKYRCTPLQLEVFRAVALLENKELLQTVLNATEAVHGAGPAHLALIAALAENAQEKPLRKVLSRSSVRIRGLLVNRCKRWVTERKIEPLKCLLKASNRLSNELVAVDLICQCIFDLYELNGDYEGALEFYENIPEDYDGHITLGDHFKRFQAKFSVDIINNK